MVSLIKTKLNIMGKIEEKIVENCNKENCTKNFTENDAVAELIVRFQEKEKPSENILVAIQHLEAVQKLLLKEAEGIEVVDAEIVK